MTICRLTAIGLLGVCSVSRGAFGAAKEVAPEGEKQPTADTTGVHWDRAPQFVLLADSNVNTLDVTQPTVSFGVQRATPFTSLKVTFRKNLATGTVSGDQGDRIFGHSVLAPELSNLGIGVRFEKYKWVFIDYDLPKTDTAKAKASADGDIGGYCAIYQANCYTRRSWLWYVAVDAAEANFKINNSSAGGFGVPVRLSTGVGYRIEGNLPSAILGTGIFAFSPFVGGS
jgi:hypothetical protein